VGRVTLKAEQLGKDVVIAVSDDGAGLDVEAIRRTAVRRGHSSAEVQSATKRNWSNLFLRPAFRPAPSSTDVSGRGVGLDVVRCNVESLNGASTSPGSRALALPLR